MGAFRYCRNLKCDRGYDKPTAREDLLEEHPCDRCGVVLPEYMTAREWIVELAERTDELEQQVKKLEEKICKNEK